MLCGFAEKMSLLSLSLSLPSSPSSGEDAVKFETLPDDVIVAKALSVLRSIFGDQIVPEVSSFTEVNLTPTILNSQR